MDAGCGGDGDDVARLAILDAEIRRGLAHHVEGRGAVQGDHGLPLLVGHLVDDAVVGVARRGHEDVDLAVAKLGGLGNEVLDVCWVKDIAWNGDGLAAVLADGLYYLVAFLYGVSYING